MCTDSLIDRVPDMALPPDLESFPLLEVEDVPYLQTHLLEQSRVQLEPLIESDEFTGTALVEHARKQLDVMRKELDRRIAEARVQALISGDQETADRLKYSKYMTIKEDVQKNAQYNVKRESYDNNEKQKETGDDKASKRAVAKSSDNVQQEEFSEGGHARVPDVKPYDDLVSDKKSLNSTHKHETDGGVKQNKTAIDDREVRKDFVVSQKPPMTTADRKPSPAFETTTLPKQVKTKKRKQRRTHLPGVDSYKSSTPADCFVITATSKRKLNWSTAKKSRKHEELDTRENRKKKPGSSSKSSRSDTVGSSSNRNVLGKSTSNASFQKKGKKWCSRANTLDTVETDRKSNDGTTSSTKNESSKGGEIADFGQQCPERVRIEESSQPKPGEVHGNVETLESSQTNRGKESIIVEIHTGNTNTEFSGDEASKETLSGAKEVSMKSAHASYTSDTLFMTQSQSQSSCTTEDCAQCNEASSANELLGDTIENTDTSRRTNVSTMDAQPTDTRQCVSTTDDKPTDVGECKVCGSSPSCYEQQVVNGEYSTDSIGIVEKSDKDEVPHENVEGSDSDTNTSEYRSEDDSSNNGSTGKQPRGVEGSWSQDHDCRRIDDTGLSEPLTFAPTTEALLCEHHDDIEPQFPFSVPQENVKGKEKQCIQNLPEKSGFTLEERIRRVYNYPQFATFAGDHSAENLHLTGDDAALGRHPFDQEICNSETSAPDECSKIEEPSTENNATQDEGKFIAKDESFVEPTFIPVDYSGCFGEFQEIFIGCNVQSSKVGRVAAGGLVNTSYKDGDGKGRASAENLATEWIERLERHINTLADTHADTKHVEGNEVEVAKYYNVRSCRSEVYTVVSRVMETLELWEPFPGDSGDDLVWSLLWTWGKPSIRRSQLLSWQRVNHFQHARELTRKDLLQRNLSRYQCLGGKFAAAFNLMPATYVLPKQYVAFAEAFGKASFDNITSDNSESSFVARHRAAIADSRTSLERRKEGYSSSQENPSRETKSCLWILKPIGMSRGRGIRLINSISQVGYSCSAVIQKYVENPLLLDGYKFDLRVYVLVTSFSPLEAFIYDEGFARVSCKEYDIRSAFDDKMMHLTNTSIQKDADPFDMPSFLRNGDKQHVASTKCSLQFLWEKLESHGVDSSKVWQSICNLVVKSLVCADDVIPNQPSSFELFGYDVLIDKNLKAWLIEINSSPSMGIYGPLDQRIKTDLIHDTVNLVDPLGFNVNELLTVLKRRLKRHKQAQARPHVVSACSGLGSGQGRVLSRRDRDELNRDLHGILGGKKPRQYGEDPEYFGRYQRLAPGSNAFNSVIALKYSIFKHRQEK